MKGGFYFRPSGEDLSPGTPFGKSHANVWLRFTAIREML